MAAYNCGEERLKNEIQQQRVRNYYELNLPLETERFLYRIAAIKLIMENPDHYGFHLAPESIYTPPEFEPVDVKIDRPVHITDFAKAIDSEFKIIKELNHHIKGYYLPTGAYMLKVPAGKKEMALEVLKRLPRNDIAAGEQNKAAYIVKPGDTLSFISEETGVSVAELQRFNNLTGTTITVGQPLQLSP